MGEGGTTDRIDGPYSRFEIFAGRRRGSAGGVSSETSAKMDIGVPFIIPCTTEISPAALHSAYHRVSPCPHNCSAKHD